MLFAQAPGIDWLQLLQTFGLAVVILFFVGLGIWRGSRWFANKIVLPFFERVVTRFVLFLERIEATISKLDANVDTVTTNLQQQTDSLHEMQSSSTKMVEAIETEHDGLKAKIEEAVLEGKGGRNTILSEVKELRIEIKEVKQMLAQLIAKTGATP